jgi:maltose O-acetyltransferase
LEARGETSEIVIGENSHINNNLTIIAEAAKITLGNRCLGGPNVMILDSDFHGLAVADRMITSRANRSSVVVGDDVFIGASVIILKGVTVGDGSVIAAGSVVAKDIPANVIAGGNPARALREL